MPEQNTPTDEFPIWTTVKITINKKRGSATTYWDKEFVESVFKDKSSGLMPEIKLIARYDKKADRICIEEGK